MIKYAILSVTDKTGIVEFAKNLTSKYGFTILTSGGTGELLIKNGIDVVNISDFTGMTEILDGRLKTLHPKIYGGILATATETHQEQLKSLNFVNIDLVVCNLYDFKNAVNTLTRNDEIIEFIDIGGPTLIRAAAKNYQRVSILTRIEDYESYFNEIENPSEIYRLELAAKAFSLISSYDIEISKYFGKALKVSNEFLEEGNFDSTYYLVGKKVLDLRYGENSHQNASLYSVDDKIFYTQLHGKSISYNNIMDLQVGIEIIDEFTDPACAIIKHRTPCGVAVADKQILSYKKALKSDSLSAFGGVFCFNREIDEETAKELSNIFIDTIIAPSYNSMAFDILSKKEKITILERKPVVRSFNDVTLIPGGFVVQNHDLKKLRNSDCQIVSDIKENDIFDKINFAWSVVKHSKSNAIVISSKTATFGIASGETSRVDAVKHAIERAGDNTKGAILASDAFFPFPDSVELAARAGIKYIVVPRGSIRDQQSIDTANKYGIILIFTNHRAFKH